MINPVCVAVARASFIHFLNYICCLNSQAPASEGAATCYCSQQENWTFNPTEQGLASWLLHLLQKISA